MGGQFFIAQPVKFSDQPLFFVLIFRVFYSFSTLAIFKYKKLPMQILSVTQISPIYILPLPPPLPSHPNPFCYSQILSGSTYPYLAQCSFTQPLNFFDEWKFKIFPK